VRSAAEGPAYLLMQHFSVSQQAGDPHAGHSTYFTTGSTHRFGVARCFNMGWGVRLMRMEVAWGESWARCNAGGFREKRKVWAVADLDGKRGRCVRMKVTEKRS
jgi:hypothetical protein